MTDSEFRAFAAKLVVRDPDDCWLWRASHTAKGYAQFYCEHGGVAGKRVTTGHRAAYEHFVGPVPEGLVLDHEACSNRGCVNPYHLAPKTHRANILRGVGASARNAAKTHCPAGHPYNAENTLCSRKGRQCRACQREHSAAYYRRRVPWEVGIPPGERTHCPQGHEYTPGNTLRKASGGRRCRACNAAQCRARHQRHKEEVLQYA